MNISKEKIMALLSKKQIFEIMRFGIVGTIAMLVHYVIYYFLLPYIDRNVAYSIGYFISFLGNFLMTSFFTFRVRPTWRRLFKFTCSHGINFFVHLGLYNFFCWVGVPVELAPLPVFLIVVPISFLLVRFAIKK